MCTEAPPPPPLRQRGCNTKSQRFCAFLTACFSPFHPSRLNPCWTPLSARRMHLWSLPISNKARYIRYVLLFFASLMVCGYVYFLTSKGFRKGLQASALGNLSWYHPWNLIGYSRSGHNLMLLGNSTCKSVVFVSDLKSTQ